MKASPPRSHSFVVALVGTFAVIIGAAGCTDDRVVTADGDAESSGASQASTTRDVTSTSGTSDMLGTASGSVTAAVDDDASTGSTGAAFLPPPGDLGDGSHQCSQLTQDCPPGYKCMPWANDGGGAWNASRCSPIAEDPVPVDGPCHMEGSPTSGIDDCEFGALCYDVDPKTLEGTCVPFCVGTEGGPGEPNLYCEDPDRFCYLSGDGAIIPCLPLCDPLEQDCPDGEACYPIYDHWSCAPDASGASGGYGDPCEFINVCDPGLICLDASTVPPGLPCEGTPGCCTEICDIDDPAGDQQCAGAAEGQTCQAWYEEGSAPVVLEDVGACALP